MRLRKKTKSGDESYWKSFTDIMAGLLMVILLVLMLLLLYMTQMNREEHKYDNKYEYSKPYDEDDNLHDTDDHKADELYDRPPQEGGGGGGVDDPGTNENNGINNDYGHDKCAVHVTVVDEETGKTIKKKGITFTLYRGNRKNGTLLTLNTYYPKKVEYKKFETTAKGDFYLPEKIRMGWYQLHNTIAPKGYSFADDTNFEITESLDWNEPHEVVVEMSPSKSIIYIKDVDADTKTAVAGGVYEIYAAADVVTLDGTVRYKAGDKVGEIKCDETGKGQSKKLYFGDYKVVQKSAAQYYAVNTSELNIKLNYLDDRSKVYTIKSRKTRVVLTLIDDQTKEPITGAVYAVTGRENLTTDNYGSITLTDLEKGKTYKVKLTDLPEPYRVKTTEAKIDVDKKGHVGGQEVTEVTQTAYIIRLVVSAQDKLFGNELGSGKLKLLDKNETVVEEWTATGEKEEFQDLEPGNYMLEVNGDKSNRESIILKDEGGLQTLEVQVWTMWDTLAIAGAAFGGVLLIVLIISLLRSRRKRKNNEEE